MKNELAGGIAEKNDVEDDRADVAGADAAVASGAEEAENAENVLDHHSTKELGARVINGLGQYEFPPIMSDSEAQHWQTMEVPKTGLYESFEEISEHCPEQLYPLLEHLNIQYIDMESDDDYPLREAASYATVAAYMDFGDLFDRELIQEGIKNRKDRWSGDRGFELSESEVDEDAFYYLPEKYDPRTEAVPLSSALHLMHKKNPALRGLAMEVESRLKKDLAREKGIDLDLEREVYLPTAKGHFLSAMDEFPGYLRALVDEKLEPWRDDLSVEYAVSWVNSHLDNGLDYDYSLPESPIVRIQSIIPESLKLAEEAIDSISQEEVDEAYKNSK